MATVTAGMYYVGMTVEHISLPNKKKSVKWAGLRIQYKPGPAFTNKLCILDTDLESEVHNATFCENVKLYLICILFPHTKFSVLFLVTENIFKI